MNGKLVYRSKCVLSQYVAICRSDVHVCILRYYARERKQVSKSCSFNYNTFYSACFKSTSQVAEGALKSARKMAIDKQIFDVVPFVHIVVYVFLARTGTYYNYGMSIRRPFSLRSASRPTPKFGRVKTL